ncbi:MAG: glycogen/starch/alpha-glucan phosphorylase [Candidatus Pacebacteria bacterium]|jgi:starch phosphorylase|nr:glycogen/starch/alpha-glucan phosphorylase [Candidatus Paceibacterota bacterium]
MSEKRIRRVACVTHEIAMMGIAPNGVELPQMYLYSGGLGTLEGAVARAAKNLNVPLVIFSNLARNGYYDQYIYDGDGTHHMGIKFIRRDYSDILEDTGVTIAVDICGKPNFVKVWKIPGHVYGTVDVYLLDADIDANGDAWAIERTNTRYLYGGPMSEGGNYERKIAQDMILGIGAVKAAEALGLDIEIWHMQESHTAFTGLYLLEKELFPVAEHLLYTNHTPDQAGNFKCGIDMLTKMYRGLPYDVLKHLGHDPLYPLGFNFGAACLRLSRLANAVSKKHLEVTKAMFSYVEDSAPIISITNGSLLQDYFQPPMFRNARTWEELQRAKMNGKRQLNEFLRGYCGKEIDINIPVVVFGRRFAQYKRPDLLLKYSRDWLLNRLGAKQFQLIIAGKPHPDDHDMIAAWTNWLRLGKEYQNLIVVPNYDMHISKILKMGSDMWLNTPRVGMEACGTSGQSAAADGAINISTVDGWMCEENIRNFFAFGTQFPTNDMDMYDANDERNGLIVALDKALALHYSNPEEWFRMALRAKQSVEQHWNAERMMKEYVERMYTL